MKSFLIAVASAGVALFIALLWGYSNHVPALGSSQINYADSATITTVASSAKAVLVSATSTARQWLSISNNGNNGVWLSFNVPAVKHTGLFLASSSTPYVIDYDHLFTGAIWAISDDGNVASTTIVEYKKTF